MGRRSSKSSKARAEELVFGVGPVAEVFAAGRRQIYELHLARGSGSQTAQLRELARSSSIPVSEASREELAKWVRGEQTQGVVARVSPYPYVTLETLTGLKKTPRRLLLADEIQDPRNLGAMIRTCEAAGFHGAVICEHRAAGITPVAVKASAGATEHLPVARVTNLANALTTLKEQGFWCFGLDGEGQSIYEVETKGELVLVVGAEGRGIRPRIRELCDYMVSLPMVGRIESLNASAAVAAAVYQMIRP